MTKVFHLHIICDVDLIELKLVELYVNTNPNRLQIKIRNRQFISNDITILAVSCDKVYFDEQSETEEGIEEK